MNKFAKAIINTYSKKNSILASEHTQRSLQVTPQFQYCQNQGHEEPINDFYYIQCILWYPKKIRSPTQEKRKQERTKTQASKKYILACQQLKVI